MLKSQNLPSLDQRLSLAASFVRHGSPICDVGTDHGYLPIFLLLSGRSPYAVVSDIHTMPLEKARVHAQKYGCTDRMRFCLTDGIADLPLASLGIRDILICGMGGELIARILEQAPYTRTDGVRCILQPMSSAADLRQLLAPAGYRIEEERLTEAAGKIYTCMAVSYDGVSRCPSPTELLLGEQIIPNGTADDPVFVAYLRRETEAVRKRRDGRRSGGFSTTEDDALLAELERIRNEKGIPV